MQNTARQYCARSGALVGNRCILVRDCGCFCKIRGRGAKLALGKGPPLKLTKKIRFCINFVNKTVQFLSESIFDILGVGGGLA